MATMTLFSPHAVSTLSLCGLLITALLAAHTDWSSWRIPNQLVAGSSLAALMIAAFGFSVQPLPSALLGGVVGLALLIPLYWLGGMGAGDVKLMGALGLHAGPWLIADIAIASAIVGGVWSTVLIFSRTPTGLRIREMASAHRLKSNGEGRASGARGSKEPHMNEGSRGTIPYGVVIAIGTLFVLMSALA